MKTRMHFILRQILFVLVAGAAAAPARAEGVDLAVRATEYLKFALKDGAFTPETCASSLKAMTDWIAGFESREIMRADLVAGSKTAINNLWRTRLVLRRKMIEFANAGKLTQPCVAELRNTFRALRFLEEYTGVHTLEPGAWIKPQPTQVFSGGFPSMVQSSSMKKLAFKSGDVLVSYGMAYGSAAIAHVGETAGSFSHMAIVYVDPKGEMHTVEAHPEVGVKVAPLDKYLRDGKGRSALFRPKDGQLAALGAKMIYKIASEADAKGQTIKYDFAMDLDDHSKLFCTEVIRYAFELASSKLGRKVMVPAFPTQIVMKSSYILDAFAIKSRVTFFPSDIEVDPQFEMLAEWRDLARVRLMHHQQAALEKQFKWLDTIDYRYHGDLRTILASRLLWVARHNPLFAGMVRNQVPPDLSARTLEAVVRVYLVSDDIHDLLILKDTAREKRASGTLMTQAEILRKVEEDREQDLEAYRRYQMWLRYDRGTQSPSPSAQQWHWLLRADSADEF